MLKIRKLIRSKYGNKYPPVERRLVIKSQPVRCIEHVPSRKRTSHNCNTRPNVPLILPVETANFPIYPDIYIDMDKDENCITTVRRTHSKIQWPNSKTGKKSRYHKKCTSIDPSTKKMLKPKKIKKKTIPSDETIVEPINTPYNCSEVFDREKYGNECYCHYDDGDTKSRSDIPAPMKPVIISECCNEKEDTRGCKDNQKVKEICKNIDYDPQSEFLNRLKKGMKKAFNCKCSQCMLEKLEKSLKYTNRRALIEGAYSDVSEILPDKTTCTKTAKLFEKPAEKCHCQHPLCSCKLSNAKHIRGQNFFETHSTEDLKTNVPPHKCLHKFELDERLVPKPFKEDCYGQSRCQFCNKTVKTSKINNDCPQCTIKKDKKVQMPSTCNVTANSYDLFSDKSYANLKKYLQPTKFSNCFKGSKTKIFEGADEKISPISPTTENTNYRSYLGKCLCDISKSSYIQNCSCQPNKKGTMPYKFSSSVNWDRRLSSGCAKVNYNDYDTILELDLQNLDNNIMSSSKFFEKCKKSNIKPNVSPYNSLALRYQRGVFN